MQPHSCSRVHHHVDLHKTRLGKRKVRDQVVLDFEIILTCVGSVLCNDARSCPPVTLKRAGFARVFGSSKSFPSHVRQQSFAEFECWEGKGEK